MDRLVVVPAVTLERRQAAAAWEALERAEALLPRDHPAARHIERALAAMEDQWRAGRPNHGAALARHAAR